MTALFDEEKQNKLKEAAAAFRRVASKPVTVVRAAVVPKPKAAVLALARTRPIIYNEWD